MEFIISDLLDDLQEVNVDILPYTSASERRIKELTMKKIEQQGKYERSRHGLGFVTKLLIAAALIAALALPVMAASGFQFTDWIQGIIKPNTNEGYDENLLLGGDSKVWDASGWAVRISAEEASATGLTFVCEELGNPEKSGTLTTTEGYWLEKWDGTTYVPMEGGNKSEAILSVEDAATARWAINWESVYGALDAGSYRIGKMFTYTNTVGGAEELTYYAKFRIFTEDMDACLEKYRTAYDALHDRESYHLIWTQYPEHVDYEYYTTEIWKNGDDYLKETRYVNEDGSLWARHGTMLRDGVGYSLQWSGEGVLSGVSEWQRIDWLDASGFDLWYSFSYVLESILGEVWDDGNSLYFYEYSDFINESNLDQAEIDALNEENPSWNHDYTEKHYRFDEKGDLVYIQVTRMRSLDEETADPIVDSTLEVFDTDPHEIAGIIEAQNVGRVTPFSWAEDQKTYGELAVTDGFVNTSASPVGSVEEAIARAKREADPRANPKYREGYEYNISNVWYDESAGMWKVRLENSQNDIFVLLVYLDDQGITRMTVYPYDDPLLTGAFSWELVLKYDSNGPYTISEGFHNTEAHPITCAQDALDLAIREMEATVFQPNSRQNVFDAYSVRYDQTADMWNAHMESSGNPYRCADVYLDADGITRMILYYNP